MICRWSKIASCLPGRTDNEIKNVWNTHLKKRLAQKDEAKRPEEQPSSPSSITTASVSCSDEGESKATEKERTEANVEANNDDEEAMDGEDIDRIEIPIEPNLDFWDVMQDSCLSESAVPQGVAADDPLVDLIEPELLDMLKDDINIAPVTTDQTTTASTASDDHPNAESDGGDEHDKWLAYLEKELELDLWGENTTNTTTMITTDLMEGGDPVATYFQALQSSTSPLDQLLY